MKPPSPKTAEMYRALRGRPFVRYGPPIKRLRRVLEAGPIERRWLRRLCGLSQTAWKDFDELLSRLAAERVIRVEDGERGEIYSLRKIGGGGVMDARTKAALDELARCIGAEMVFSSGQYNVENAPAIEADALPPSGGYDVVSEALIDRVDYFFDAAQLAAIRSFVLIATLEILEVRRELAVSSVFREEWPACPFCGSRILTYDFSMCIHCRRCGATGPDFYATEAEALLAWGHRADVAGKEKVNAIPADAEAH